MEWFWTSELPNVIMLRVSDEAARCMPLAGIDEVGGGSCVWDMVGEEETNK